MVSLSGESGLSRYKQSSCACSNNTAVWKMLSDKNELIIPYMKEFLHKAKGGKMWCTITGFTG